MTHWFGESFLEGRRLTSQAAEQLEGKLAQEPEDEHSRFTLIGYYCKRAIWKRVDRERVMNHELWFIRNKPDHPELRFVVGSIVACWDSDLYELGKAAWLEHVHEGCTDVAILMNAASFFSMWDSKMAIRLVERARVLEPSNRKLLHRLAHIHDLALLRNPDDTLLRRAYEVRKELAEAEPEAIDQLVKFAEVALRCGDFSAARVAAQKVLEDKSSESQSIRSEAHSILGRIYLREGDLKAARVELLNCAANSEYELENEFVAIGEREIVCEHLWRSLPAWKFGRIQLLMWIFQLRLGGSPTLKRTWLLSYGIGGYAGQ